MNQIKIKTIRLGGMLLLACMLAFGLTACLGNGEANTAANENRQSLSTMNSKIGEIKTVMEDFEEAAANYNIVGMKSQLDKAEEIKAEIEALEVSDALTDAKAAYVEALGTMNGVMTSYVNLFDDVQNGSLSADDASATIEQIQSEYDKGIEQLQKADEAISKLAS